MSEDRRDDRLDRLLVEALGRMVGGDEPADMRARVLARLAEPRRRAPFTAVALAAAAVILVGLAVVVWRVGRYGPAPAVTTAQRYAPAGLTPSPPAPSPRSPDTTLEAPKAGSVRPHAVRTRPSAPVARPEPDEVDETAADMEPIDVAPLVVTPMDTPKLALAPLSLEPMQIAPLEESLPEQP